MEATLVLKYVLLPHVALMNADLSRKTLLSRQRPLLQVASELSSWDPFQRCTSKGCLSLLSPGAVSTNVANCC